MLPLVLSACSAAEQPDEESAPSPSADEAETDDEVPDDEHDDQDQQEESAPESSPESSSGPAAEPSPPPELPGGGDELFPDRRLIALYGTPGVPALGALGEQDVDAAIDRITDKAETYQDFSEEPVQPAFEIITTVATPSPGLGVTTPTNSIPIRSSLGWRPPLKPMSM